jgi:hypothetical protein
MSVDELLNTRSDERDSSRMVSRGSDKQHIAVPRPESLSERLEVQKAILEEKTKLVQEALAALNRNPEVKETFDKVNRALQVLRY